LSLIAQRMSHLGTENAFKLGDDIQRCVDRGMDVIRFNLGAPDFRSAPHLNRVASQALDAGNSGYCDPAGILPFREAIAAHVTRTRGVDVTPGRVIVTPGAKPPIGYTLQTYVDAGDEVIYPSPGFPIYESWVRFARAVPVPLPLSDERDFAFTADDLVALVTERTKVIILCSPSNPTGGVLSRDDLAGIAALVRERCRPDVRIYADEIYEHILFDGLEHESIMSHEGMAERTVLASGHSKGFAMTGWRLGWAVLPTEKEAAIFKQLNINIMSCVPPFLQEAGAAAYDALPEDERMEAETILVCYSNRFVTGDTATIDYEAGVRMTPNGLRLAEPARPDALRDRRSNGAHERPLVRVHPPTGRKVLWASPKNLDHLEIGRRVLTGEQSRARLEELLQYGTATEESALVYEHRWKRGDVVLMDNRQILHSTTPYGNHQHDPGRQLMHHVSLRGRRPQPGWTDVGALSGSATP